MLLCTIETSSTVETKSSRKNRKKRSKNPVEVEIISGMHNRWDYTFDHLLKSITIICKNTDVPEPVVIVDPITQLKQQIEEAKSAKVFR